MDDSVLGEPLLPCSTDPTTGYDRSGYCRALEGDAGRHHVCAEMTDEFLTFTAAQGNDLSTPRPELNFPGLAAGDRWCLCVDRWLEAHEAGRAPPVVLAATNAAVTEVVDRQTLEANAVEE